MKKVLVTGASGYIGKYSLQPLLDRGFKVIAIYSKNPGSLKNKNIIWYQCDLMNSISLNYLIEEFQPEYLLHFAWYTCPGKFWSSFDNLKWLSASLELLEIFSKYGKRVVFAGSCAEYNWNYGYCKEYLTPLEPTSLYGECKNSLQRLFTIYCDQKKISFSWGRIFFLYGPTEPKEKLFSATIKSLIENKNFEITAGNLIRDFLYVEDVANAFVTLLDSEVMGAVNISSGIPVKIKDLVTMIGDRLGKTILIKFKDESNINSEPSMLIGSNERLINEVKFIPLFTLEIGINKTINYWLQTKKATLNE